jgi:hypothetical protein
LGTPLELERDLLAGLHDTFDPIRQLTIEDVIREQAEQVSPRARRQQLFRLATPSWNVDRTRLPEGGAGLVRLEVMGVPDENNTLFEGEPMLVSTRDPHRLVALVVAAGAPPAALQQAALYREAMERVRGMRPLFVLPEFLANANQAHLAFALGHVFEMIFNQGAYFYYRPADPLDSPLLLANGLANSLQTLAGRDGLVPEIMERVEGRVARMGLQEAIALLDAYTSNVPDGSTRVDDLTRDLKRLVRDYTEELRRIDEFNAGLIRRPGEKEAR